MKTNKVEGEITSAFGKPVSPALKFVANYETYESWDELKRVKDGPLTEKEQVAVRNAEAKANAVSAARAAVLEENEIKAPAKDDPNVIFDNVVKQLLITPPGKTPRTKEQAETMAEGMLGYGRQ